MFGLKQISRWQFGFMRIALGLYLLLHFWQLLPYAGELFSAAGTLSDPNLSPLYNWLPSPFWISDSPTTATLAILLALFASIALTLGWRRKLAAALLLYLWAALFTRNPLIANPSLAYVGLMLVLSLLVPHHEALRVGPCEPRKWFFPSGVYWTAWLLLAAGYTFSGLIKLYSPSWIDGSALIHLAENPLARPGFFRESLLLLPSGMLHLLTWISLAGEILFLPLSLFRRGRLAIWTLMLSMHWGILLVVDFFDLTAAMVLIHCFVFDPDWLPPRNKNKRRILFYDGDCGLCATSVKFLLEADTAGLIQYAPLLGETAQSDLPPELRNATEQSTVVYLRIDAANGKRERLVRSKAILSALIDIGGIWRILGWLIALVPSYIRENSYKFIAKHRLKVFPKSACALPSEEERARLLP